MQGEVYIKEDADKWFDRNDVKKGGGSHNCFTEYLLNIFPKANLKTYDVAEFGVGSGNNINLLSHYINNIDGYDGSKKSINRIKDLSKIKNNIDGKVVNLGAHFDGIRKYDLIIFGFFTYMLTDIEFKILLKNSKKLLNEDGYIFIYDFLARENNFSKDIHNETLNIYKRNLKFYLEQFKDFDIIDYRLYDNRKLKDYMDSDNFFTIDTMIDKDDYNWTFSSLFKFRN